jgi:hypothetical protein
MLWGEEHPVYYMFLVFPTRGNGVRIFERGVEIDQTAGGN